MRCAVRSSIPRSSAPATKRGRQASIASSLRFRLIARRSPSASPIERPAEAIATSSTWSWKTTTPSVSRSGSRSDSCSTGGSYVGSSRRHLRRQVLEVLGDRLQQALHLCAALDLEDADRVGPLDLLVHALVVERHP